MPDIADETLQRRQAGTDVPGVVLPQSCRHAQPDA